MTVSGRVATKGISSMKTLARAAGIAALALFIASAGEAQTSAPAAPTFSKDVAPIFYKNCVTCHRPGSVAPMSLITYEDARPWATTIGEKVAQGNMPPWHSSDPRGTFLNDRRLTQDEKDTIIRWVSAGAPQGNAADMPPAPEFAEGWQIGKPDVVLSMSEPFEVPASGTIPYQYFKVPTNFTEDNWVQAIEVRPGARNVVHHILVFSKAPGEGRRTDIITVVPHLEERHRAAGQPDDNPGVLIATTAPGTNAMSFQPGTAMLIKAGSVLTFQMHYMAMGTATKDRSSIGIVFAKHPPTQEVRTGAFFNPVFTIPAGDDNAEVDCVMEFKQDSHLWAIFPHTHLRGKSWAYRVIYPDGTSKKLLTVPKYDFNWQTYYILAKPLALPKGTRIEGVAHYDNSTNNRSNPDPTKDVHWGDQTWEEMQYTGVAYTLDDQSSGQKTAQRE
ncbi:MAG TPA: cytochrome c [Candidatus Acidoferrales bacterium]|nr:cytochrome c [Candidatus Acidoferrales bacterium]